jgi:6-phosphogluconolactonase
MTDYIVNSKEDNIKSFRTDEELFNAAAEELKDKINSSAERGKKFYFAISGGNSPVPLFKMLAVKYSDIKWEYVELFWVDERMVPSGDNESNYGTAKKNLLDYINLPAENIHFVNGSDNPSDEVKSYGEEIIKNVPFQSELPSFDMIWLGIGNDGHTASIFPGEKLTEYKRVTGISEHPQTKQIRITLTAPLINNAQEIRFIVPGDDKREILKKIFDSKDLTLPASRINPSSGKLKWFIKSQDN